MPRLRGGRGRVLAAVPARGESEHGHEKHDEGTRTSYRVGPTHLPPFYNGTRIAPPVQSLSTNYRERRKSEVQLRRTTLPRTRAKGPVLRRDSSVSWLSFPFLDQGPVGA